MIINQKIKILHTAFLYCTGFRSNNTTTKNKKKEYVRFYVLVYHYSDHFCILNAVFILLNFFLWYMSLFLFNDIFFIYLPPFTWI